MRILGHNLRKWAIKLATQHATPHEIALGLAAGIFVGWLPIMGIQMIVVLLLTLPFRINRFAAASGVWITNPITFIPMYAFTYWVGAFFWRIEKVLSYEDFKAAFAGRDTLSGFFALLTEGKEFLIDIFICTWIGGAIVGILTAIPTYIVTRRAVAAYRMRRSARMPPPER